MAGRKPTGTINAQATRMGLVLEAGTDPRDEPLAIGVAQLGRDAVREAIEHDRDAGA